MTAIMSARNVIFPAWTVPYAWTVLLTPIAIGAFVFEGWIHSRRESLPRKVAIRWALVANVVSSVVGVFLAVILEGRWSWFRRNLGYDFDMEAVIKAWCYAFLLSVLVELPFLRTRRPGASWRHRLGTVILANLASYSILAGAVSFIELVRR